MEGLPSTSRRNVKANLTAIMAKQSANSLAADPGCKLPGVVQCLTQMPDSTSIDLLHITQATVASAFLTFYARKGRVNAIPMQADLTGNEASDYCISIAADALALPVPGPPPFLLLLRSLKVRVLCMHATSSHRCRRWTARRCWPLAWWCLTHATSCYHCLQISAAKTYASECVSPTTTQPRHTEPTASGGGMMSALCPAFHGETSGLWQSSQITTVPLMRVSVRLSTISGGFP